MTNKELVERAVRIASKHKTAYMWGTFGAPITESLIESKTKQYPSYYSAARQKALRTLTGKDYWAFDCVGLIKGILWGWNGSTEQKYGGAVYQSNDVPDTNVSGMKKLCTDLSDDWTSIVPGELVFMSGHVGVYVGDGKCAEATLANGHDGVVITNLAGRGWREHGKLKFIEYEEEKEVKTYIHVEKIGLRVRETLTFNGKKPTGKILAFCPAGGDMLVTEFIPGIQKDGYQWVRVKYNGVDGVAQYDSACYYIYQM